MFLSFLSTINPGDADITVLDTTDTGAVPYYYGLICAVRIENPTSLVYNGNLGAPDITHPGSLSFTNSLPALGGILPIGTYKVKLTGRFTKRAGLTYVDLGANSISIPAGITDIEGGDSIELIGGSNAGTYTIQSVGTNAYGVELVLVETLSSAVVDDLIEWTWDDELETTYYYNITPSCAKIQQSYNCVAQSFKSQDITNYNLLFTGSSGAQQYIAPGNDPDTNRIHTLNYPDGLGNIPVVPPVTSNLAIVQTTDLWTKTWTTEMTNSITYTLPSGLQVTIDYEAEDDEEVKCDNNLCCIRECINTLYDRYHNALRTNETEAQRLWYIIGDLNGAYLSYDSALNCGDNEDIQKYYQIMKDIVSSTDCPCDCGCDGDDELPQEVIGVFPIAVNGMAVVVQSGDVYLVCTPVTVGSTTTYTLTLATDQIETLIATYINDNPTLITAIVAAAMFRIQVDTKETSLDTVMGFTGDIEIGSDEIASAVPYAGTTNVDYRVGMPIYAAGIPLGTHITDIAPGVITISNVATANTFGLNATCQKVQGGIAVILYKRLISGSPSYTYVLQTKQQDSITVDSTTQYLKLVNDLANPGNNMVYATDSGGIRVWRAIVALFGSGVSFNRNAAATTITTASEVIGNTLNLAAGTYILMTNALIVGGYVDQISARLKDGASVLKFMGLDLDNTNSINNNSANIMMVYTSINPIVLTVTYQAGSGDRANALRDRDLVAIKIA